MNQTGTIITPLSTEQQQKVVAHTQRYIKQACELFELKNKPLEITFNLKGRCAGMYRIKQRKGRFFSQAQREIRYNPFIFAKYFTDNYETTVPHEVAHYVTDMLYGLKNIKPHGREWQAVMAAFNADASVTADYDLAGIPLKQQTLFSYRCDCREHQLTSIRHNKVKKRRYRYYCTHCKQMLHFSSPAKVTA